MKFCKAAHRKAFDKEGEKPIDVILRKQERRMRQIAREEVTAALDRFATISLLQIIPKLLDRYYSPQSLGPKVDLDLETELEKLAKQGTIKPS
jgi:lysyl-tRNA synthetase class II